MGVFEFVHPTFHSACDHFGQFCSNTWVSWHSIPFKCNEHLNEHLSFFPFPIKHHIKAIFGTRAEFCRFGTTPAHHSQSSCHLIMVSKLQCKWSIAHDLVQLLLVISLLKQLPILIFRWNIPRQVSIVCMAPNRVGFTMYRSGLVFTALLK